jgi:hypothetical protein
MRASAIQMRRAASRSYFEAHRCQGKSDIPPLHHETLAWGTTVSGAAAGHRQQYLQRGALLGVTSAIAAEERNGNANTSTAPSPDGNNLPPGGPPKATATLLVKCPDTKGVVASLAQLLYGFGCNITASDQFSDLDDGMFYQVRRVCVWGGGMSMCMWPGRQDGVELMPSFPEFLSLPSAPTLKPMPTSRPPPPPPFNTHTQTHLYSECNLISMSS